MYRILTNKRGYPPNEAHYALSFFCQGIAVLRGSDGKIQDPHRGIRRFAENIFEKGPDELIDLIIQKSKDGFNYQTHSLDFITKYSTNDNYKKKQSKGS